MAAKISSKQDGKANSQTIAGRKLMRVNDGNLISEDGRVLFSWDYDEKCWEIRFVGPALNQRFERLKDAVPSVCGIHEISEGRKVENGEPLCRHGRTPEACPICSRLKAPVPA